MAIPTLAGFTAGEKVLATKLTDHTKTAIEASVYFKPACKVRSGAAQSIANASDVTVNVDTTDFDTDTMADLTNDRIVIKTAGLYRIGFLVGIDANATGNRIISLKKNGTTILRDFKPGTTGDTNRFHSCDLVRLAVNDLLTLIVNQTSGGALFTSPFNGGTCMWAEWVSK